MKNNKIIILTILIILLVIGLFFGITYAYFDLTIKAEDSSTMVIGGAEVSASFVSTSTITVEDAIPSDEPIGYKDFSITVKNTSNNSYKLYLKIIIDLNTFTDTENDGVLYYDIYSGANHDTVVQEKTMFPTISFGKFILKELTIPAKTNTTTQYRLNLYFPDSDKVQNKNGRLSLNAKITIENDNSTSTSIILASHLNNLYMNAASANGLEQDDTSDKNIRYVGASPKNYLKFNGETWRIIGVFNVYNTETGKYEKLTKIIRNESLGRYSWDSSEETVNNGQGINEWNQADLMTELNTDYVSTSQTSGTTNWYNGQNNTLAGSYDYSKNIKSDWVDKIANVRWNIGGANWGTGALDSYNDERGTAVTTNPADGITRKTTWDGKIALMYPSDYGYASSSTTCRSNMNSSTNSVSNCKENNWLFIDEYQWTLSPRYYKDSHVFYAHSNGFITDNYAYNNYGVRPTLYLKSDVAITGGNGNENDSYILN